MPSPLTYRLATSAIIAALAWPALAQNPPAAQPAAGARQAAAPAGNRADHLERHRAHQAKRLAALKEQLKLTAAQEPAWSTFTSAMQPGERTARLDRKDMDQLTTPERIDRMRALRAQRSAEADRRGEATKAFYAALTPEQQKTFDAQALRYQHRGGHHGGPGHPGKAGEHHHQPGGPARAGAPSGAAMPAPAR